jgi:hypothetical protein
MSFIPMANSLTRSHPGKIAKSYLAAQVRLWFARLGFQLDVAFNPPTSLQRKRYAPA